MIGIAFGQSFFEQRPKLFVADQAPVPAVVIARRRLRGEPLDNQVGTQPAENLDEEIDVLLDGPEAEPPGGGIVFGRHRRPAEDLQLVELHCRERQGVDLCGLRDKLRIALARKPEDEVRADGEPPGGSHLDGPPGAGEVVAPVHGPQRGIKGRFDTVLDSHIPVACQRGEQVERRVIHTVGACPDDEARNVRV